MHNTKTRFAFTLLAFSSLALTACSTSPEAQLAKQKQAEYKQRVKDRDQTLKATPAWYLETKVSDVNGSLGRGTGFSRDMQLAFDEATLRAQEELGRNTKLLLSEQFKSHRRNNGLTGEVSMLLNATADRYLPEVDTSGAKVLRREIKADRDGFRAFVLLHLDIAERDRERMANAALELAHQELMQRNARYRAEQAAANQAVAAQ
ncbi:hypothetical protein AEST_25370 [Alishewanella aestuarii B11]|uniref:Lipoprotein n=1 Tax=Alishewanella aestuarii B11 TaxID=1197174 RepID=J2ID49_9ALTE|nr:hypothetical protein [Alishewanella aestuarii]EJI84604.1 hypothetical protein AEST_25370 [Alishewanella aestuarii B11]